MRETIGVIYSENIWNATELSNLQYLTEGYLENNFTSGIELAIEFNTGIPSSLVSTCISSKANVHPTGDSVPTY